MHYAVAPGWRTQILAEAEMPYAYLEALRFLAVLIGIGAAGGMLWTMVAGVRRP